MGTLKIDNGKIYQQVLGKWNMIGEIDFAERTLAVYRDREKHLMKMFDGYGFSKDLIDSSRFFDFILIKEKSGEDEALYLIPREEILLYGQLYKAEGYEKQIFISLEKLKNFKIA